MKRRCNARTRQGGLCGNAAVPGHWRCRLHGGLSRSSGPRHLTPKAIAARVARMQAGRARWLERMRLAKQQGLIDKVPGGRRRQRSKDRHIAQAQRVVEEMMVAKNSTLPTATSAGDPPAPLGEKPWDRMTKAEKLSRATDLALDCARQILELGIDPKDVKLLAQVKDTALTIISQQIRLDALKELQARGDAPAAKVRDEERRLLDSVFGELGMRRSKIIESGGDGEEP